MWPCNDDDMGAVCSEDGWPLNRDGTCPHCGLGFFLCDLPSSAARGTMPPERLTPLGNIGPLPIRRF